MKNIFEVLGVESNNTEHSEKLISALGGFFAIFFTMGVSFYYLDTQGAVLIVASMGASAVLLFAVPHGSLSQPWPLLGGHFISAILGVACAQTLSNPLIAAPCAVGLAIAAMHYLRCLHPPGGGTALASVIGGASVHELGYQFVLAPVLLNVVAILLIAIAYNNLFSMRRYPANFRKRLAEKILINGEASSQLSHADFEYALREIGSYIDITERDLAMIYQLAVKHARRISDSPETISVGNYYANGEYRNGWSVRKVLKIAGNTGDATVTYKVVDGESAGEVQNVTLADFTCWKKYEVIMEKGTWHRIMQA